MMLKLAIPDDGDYKLTVIDSNLIQRRCWNVNTIQVVNGMKREQKANDFRIQERKYNVKY